MTRDNIDEQLAVHDEHPTLMAIVAARVSAGLRRQEAVWPTAADVDLGRRMIRVRAKTVERREDMIGWKR